VADILVPTKSDLPPHLRGLSFERAKQYLCQLAANVPFVPVNARQRTGIDPWIGWLRAAVPDPLAERASGERRRSGVGSDGASVPGGELSPLMHDHPRHGGGRLRDVARGQPGGEGSVDRHGDGC
jgi:hypothetical protein